MPPHRRTSPLGEAELVRVLTRQEARVSLLGVLTRIFGTEVGDLPAYRLLFRAAEQDQGLLEAHFANPPVEVEHV